MAWNDLLSNQMVSFTDAQGSGFTLNSGQSHVTSNQLMTKNDWIAKYNIVVGNLSGLAENQLVQKSLLSSITVYSSAIYSASATKNNCPAGYTGTSVTLSSTFGQFTSTMSQNDADQQAYQWVQNNVQAYGNTNGACIGNALTISYSINEQAIPFTDANIFIGNSRTGTVEQFQTGNYAVGAISGDSINVVANSLLDFPWPANSTLRLIVKVNGIEVSNTTTTTNGQSISYNIGVVNSTNTYEIIVQASTTELETVTCGPTQRVINEYGTYQYSEVFGSLNHDVYKTQRTVTVANAGNSTLFLGVSGETSGEVFSKKFIIKQGATVLHDTGWIDVTVGGSNSTPTLTFIDAPVIVEMYSAWPERF